MPVYLARSGLLVKIGFTAGDVAKRVSRIQAAQPLTILRVLDADRDVEKALHKQFASLRHHGEWFSFSKDMLGDLGAPDFVAAPQPAEPTLPMEPTRQKIAWTDEARAMASEKRRAALADPVKGPLIRAAISAGVSRSAARRRVPLDEWRAQRAAALAAAK
jgi:hypothetical protein